ESARGFFPEVSWGLFVTGGVSAILPNLIGLQKTKELLMLGERYGAAALHELGIAWRVAPDDALLDEAVAVAERLAALPERAVRDMKRTLNRAAYGDVAEAMEREVDAVARSYNDPETFERIAAFSDR
ncbi:MAG: enoyl-CoA hydratase-related protein, partial [Alphaproteobacteria bacterium]|nr:enoyl-CoA hydratase-related protein [Alphaproteobacteria bacterium]